MAGTVNLFVNRNNTRGLASGLIKSATDPTPVAFPNLVVGDSLSLSLKVVSDVAAGSLETLTGYSIKLGIGTPGSVPTGGTFTLTDGVDTTSALAYSITATDLQTALNALNASAGPFSDTVTVTGSVTGPYKITWDSNGSQTALAVGTAGNLLTPLSDITVSEIQDGTGALQEIQSVSLFQQPLVLVTSWTISGTTATASVDLSNFNLYQAVIDAGGEVSKTVEIEITDAVGDIATLLQRPATISAEVLPNGVGAGSLSSAAYALQSWVLSYVNPTISEIDNADSPYTASDNEIIIVDMSAGAVEIDLPASATFGVKILREGATNALTVDPNLTDTIRGAATLTINGDDTAVNLIKSGTDWKVI